MGASGIWQLLAKYPGYFTAAMPASATYMGKGLTPFQFTPIVCTTGTEERSYERNKQIIEELRNAGADATFIPLNGKNHVDACNSAFSYKNLDLLFSKHK